MTGRATVRPGGVSLSVPRRALGSPGGGKRKEVNGWSRSTARRCSDFLQSVDQAALKGFNYSMSLTVRDLPSADEWARIRAAFLQGLRRLGATRYHWLTEWQGRGIPHFHMLVAFPGPRDVSKIVDLWLRLTCAYNSQRWGQMVEPTWGVPGWLQYLGKHGSRGVNHYQRSLATMPKSWAEVSGRMWGYGGEWPRTTEDLELSRALFYKLRRAVFRLRGLSSSRHCAAASSEVLGASDWCPSSEFWRLVRFYCWSDPRCRVARSVS